MKNIGAPPGFEGPKADGEYYHWWHLEQALVALEFGLMNYPQNQCVMHLHNAGQDDLVGEIFKIELNDLLKSVMSGDQKTMEHGFLHASQDYLDGGKYIIDDSSRAKEIEKALCEAGGAFYEDSGKPIYAVVSYRAAGLVDRAREIDAELDKPISRRGRSRKVPLPSVVKEKLFGNALAKLRERFKDHIFMTMEEKEAILEGVKKKVRLLLDEKPKS